MCPALHDIHCARSWSTIRRFLAWDASTDPEVHMLGLWQPLVERKSL